MTPRPDGLDSEENEVAKTQVSAFFPKRPPHKTTRDLIAFRPPSDIDAYIEEVKSRGYVMSDVIVKLLRLGIEMESQLSEADLERVSSMARIKDVSVGTMLGRLALEGLAKHPKR